MTRTSSRRNAAAEKRHQRLAQRVRPSEVKIIFGAGLIGSRSPGGPSRSATRRAIAGAGSIQSTGHGASRD